MCFLSYQIFVIGNMNTKLHFKVLPTLLGFAISIALKSYVAHAFISEHACQMCGNEAPEVAPLNWTEFLISYVKSCGLLSTLLSVLQASL